VPTTDRFYKLKLVVIPTLHWSGGCRNIYLNSRRAVIFCLQLPSLGTLKIANGESTGKIVFFGVGTIISIRNTKIFTKNGLKSSYGCRDRPI